jgi:flagellin
MSAVLNTNVASLWASKNLLGAQSKLAGSVERLSSGLRINRARDDAAGLGVANSLTAQINGANQGVRNLNDAISMVQTAEGAIAAASEMGQRILMLATQGANGTLGSTERAAIQSEMQQLLSSIDSIAGRTQFSGNPLLGSDPRATSVPAQYSMQISNSATDKVSLASGAFLNIGGYAGVATADGTTASTSVTLTAAPAASIVGTSVYKWTAGANSTTDGSYVLLGKVASVSGATVTFAAASAAAWTAASDKIVFSGQLTQELSSTDGDLSLAQAVGASSLTSSTASNATSGFQMVQRAANAYVVELGKQRSLLGAYQNQMEYTLSNITELSSNLQSARSRVIDTDYASETASLTKGQILQQAATAMLAQANQMPNVILTLLK